MHKYDLNAHIDKSKKSDTAKAGPIKNFSIIVRS